MTSHTKACTVSPKPSRIDSLLDLNRIIPALHCAAIQDFRFQGPAAEPNASCSMSLLLSWAHLLIGYGWGLGLWGEVVRVPVSKDGGRNPSRSETLPHSPPSCSDSLRHRCRRGQATLEDIKQLDSSSWASKLALLRPPLDKLPACTGGHGLPGSLVHYSILPCSIVCFRRAYDCTLQYVIARYGTLPFSTSIIVI